MSKQLFSRLNSFVRLTARAIPCLVALIVAQFAVAQSVPTFTPLGSFDANSVALFVNGDGNLVTGLSANQTFRWSTSGNGLISLGRLPQSESPAIATSASRDQSAVVGFSESWNEIPLQSTRKVVLWTPEQGWIDLGTPFESSEHWEWNSEPRISANGSVVLAMSSSSLGNKLWRWTAGVWSNLGQAPNQRAWIIDSEKISDDGEVIIASALNQAFRWTSSGWIGLGNASGSTSFYATGMSGNGTVVVGVIRGTNSQFVDISSIFRWTADGLVDLGSPLFGTLNDDDDLFVSGDGSVIAGSATDLESVPHIFRLTVVGGFEDLEPLPENHTHAEVAAINEDGSILVGFSRRTNLETGVIETTQPFRTIESEIVSLGLLPGEATDAVPIAISIDGSVIVGVMWRQLVGLPNQFADIRAFRWTSGNGVGDLGSFQTPIYPQDLSHDGSVLVGSADFSSFTQSTTNFGLGAHPFRWSSDGLNDLGVNTLQGEFDSHAEFVSGDGTTVVGTMKFQNNGSPNFSRAFRWKSSVGKVDLGTLPRGSGQFDSSAYIHPGFLLNGSRYNQESGKCVSSDGSVIVGTSESFFGGLPMRRAFRWTSSGMINLGTLGEGQSSSSLAVSKDGFTVVGASGNFETNLTTAFRWTSGNGMVSLGTLLGTDSSAALFTSSNGAVVVGTSTLLNAPTPVRKAFRWKDGVMTNLGSLPDGAQDFYWPVAINDDGSVIVGLSEKTNEQGITTRRAFRWTNVGGMTALPLEITHLHGSSLSGNGAIVVGSRVDAEVGKRACIWSAALGFVDLWEYLVGRGVANLGEINLVEAGISKDGRSIALAYQEGERDAAGIVRGLQFVTSNDDCANALPIELGSVSFNTAGSTTDGNNPTAQYCGPATGNFFNDIWFSFTPSSTGIFSASTCNQANFDIRIDILDGCGGTLLACNDDACPNLTSHVEFSGVAGQIYLIRLGAYINTFGAGTLTLALVGSAPSISSVSPSSGTTLGGTVITIIGENLTGATGVTVGGVAATSVVVVSSTSVTAVTPAGSAGAKSVAVTTAGGTASLPSAFTFVVPAPTISSVSPSSGTTLGGTVITITGENLTGTTSVTVGGVAATSVVVVNATSITAVTPAGTAGVKTIAVTTPSGTVNLPNAFSYVVPAPTGVSASAGSFTNKVLVSWSAVSGGTGFKIFRSGTEIGTVGISSLLFNDMTAVPGTSYVYFVKTVSAGGLSPESLSNVGYRNLSAPTSVAASDGTSTLHISVTWVASIGATGYQIFRSGTVAPIGTASATTFNDVGASAGVAYTYTVRATGVVGVSAASAGNSGFRALSEPNGVAASDGTSAASVVVTWTVAPGATAYKIFRSGSASAIGTVGAVTTYSDTSAPVGVLFTYTVKAVYGTIGMSAASSGNTGYRNRPAPANVNATDTDITKVRVTWSAVTSATGYEVFRSIGGAPATLIASPSALLFDDTTIARGTTAVYSVRAKFVLTGSSPAMTVTTLMSATNSGTRP